MYTTSANIAAYLKRALTSEESTYFTSVLDEAIDAYINRITGTSFGATASGQVFVNGEESNMLVIPTMHDITEVAKIDDSGAVEEIIPVDDYRTWPQGKDDKLAIRALNDGEWEEGWDNYRITGELGYKVIPKDIVDVATEMAANTLSANVNNYKMEKVGDWSVTYPDAESSLSIAAQGVLAGYRRLSRSI